MKKSIFITVLIFAFTSMMVFPAAQHTSYQKVKAFMEDYYNAFNLSAQDAQTIDLMDEYWAPEFVATQYLPLPQYLVMNLQAWKAMMVYVHTNVKETLTVDEMSIDMKTLSVVCRLSIQFHYRSTGELALKTDAIAFYNLKIDNGCKLKQTAIKLYFADPVSIMILSGPPPTM